MSADDLATEQPPDRNEEAGERGSLAMLLLGFVAIALGVLLVGIDATAGQLARIETLNAADAAARDAADEVSEDAYYGGEGALLDPVGADAAARGSLAAQLPSSRIEGWQVDHTTVGPDGRSATVQVTAQVHFPVTGFVRAHALGSHTVTVASTARGDLPVP